MGNIIFDVNKPSHIVIGYAGEHEVRTVTFDYASWISEVGNGVLTLEFQRPTDTAPYPIAVEGVDGNAVWTVSETDTAVKGTGEAQLVYVVDGKRAKSAVFPVTINRSLGQTGETPDPYESWIDTLTELGAITVQNAQSALESAQTATQAKDDAVTAKTASETAQTSAELAQSKSEQAQSKAETAQTKAEQAQASAEESATGANEYMVSAMEFADEASESAETAKTKANEAWQSASGASTFATSAGQSALSARDSATSAETSAGSASASATSASGSAETASTKASEASASAESASGSATSASASAETASTKASEASASAEAASTKAGEASQSATSASESAESAESASETAQTYAEMAVESVMGKANVIRNSASGNIVSFSDGAVMDADSFVIGFEPVQDLHGYDYPWPEGGGKNLCPPKSYLTNNNMFFGGDSSATRVLTVEAGTYTFSVVPSDGQNVAVYIMDESNTNAYASESNGKAVTATFAEQTNIVLKAYTSRFSSGLTITQFQLEKGSTATDYAPYTNICPISGWTGVEGYVRGRNLWDEEWEVGAIVNGVPVSSTTSIRSANYCDCRPGVSYYVKSIIGLRIHWYDSTKAWIEMSISIGNGTITAPSNAYFYKIAFPSAYGTTYNHDVSINYPSTDHDYHPYSGHDYPLTWQSHGTIYGGYVDVVSGVLTVTYALIDLGTLNWTYQTANTRFFTDGLKPTIKYGGNGWLTNLVCSIYPARTWNASYDKFISEYAADGRVYIKDTAYDNGADFKTAMNGVQLAYELAEPTTIQLDPQIVQTLLGDNTVFSNANGEVSIGYKADTKLYTDNKFAELEALIANS